MWIMIKFLLQTVLISLFYSDAFAFTSPTSTTIIYSSKNSKIKHNIKFHHKYNSRITLKLSQIPESEDDKTLKDYLKTNNLRAAIRIIKNNSSTINFNKEQIGDIFSSIERRTMEAEENNINLRAANEASLAYPLTSPARMEMTSMYNTLKDKGVLNVFGAASDGNFPAQGSKVITPTLLEQITNLSMISLTPQPTNTLLIAGAAFAVFEGIFSVYTGVNLNFLILLTLFLAFLDKLLVNGAVFETITRVAMPEYSRKILRHEAGHFLCAYLLGCPVEGCVLNSWAALADARFGGRRTTVSAGTSFFDPDLSDEINGRKPVSRSSIDRYSVIVMAGIAAEALNFGRADGGAGDEAALISFLSNLNPKSGGAVSWDLEGIKNQARWGALQAVLLLREYNASYLALVDALEKGGSLGECVYAIESAARENGLPGVAAKPLGYIVNEGPFGQWVTTSLDMQNQNNNELETSSKVTIEEEIVSLEDLKVKMQQKLKDIDSQLDKFSN